MATKKRTARSTRDEVKAVPEDAIQAVLAETDRCMVSFSLGKDSWATWFALKGRFRELVPVFLELVPNLPFVVDYLKYAEDLIGQKIYRFTHPSFYRMMHNGVFLPKHARDDMLASELTFITDYDTPPRLLAEDLKWPAGQPWVAAGVRMSDSPMRRAAMRRMAFIDRTRKKFYPIADMDIATLEALLRKNKVLLPIDYDWFGRSFDGVTALYTPAIFEHDPESAAVLEQWFPLIKADIWRHRYRADKSFHQPGDKP